MQDSNFAGIHYLSAAQFLSLECDLDHFLSSFVELRKQVGGGHEKKDHGASSFTQATNCNSSIVQSEMIKIQSLKIPIQNLWH